MPALSPAGGLCNNSLHKQLQGTPSFGVCGSSSKVSVFSAERRRLRGLDLSLGVPKGA